MSATSLEALIQANGQAMETRQRIPYEMVVYAIPEEWREEEMMLLRNAVEFQPTLYGMIDTLATRQELQQIQAQQLRIRIHMQEPVHALSPHFRSAAMKLVQDHVVRTNFRHFLRLHGQELCIGEEVNILRLLSSGDGSQILHLCPENISAGRQPANRFVRMVRAELKGDKGFSGAGGMHDRSLSLILQHSACRVVCSLVVGK